MPTKRMIIMGETHGFLEDKLNQARIIRRIKPGYVLMEQESSDSDPDETYDAQKRGNQELLLAIKETGTEIIRCDAQLNNAPENRLAAMLYVLFNNGTREKEMGYIAVSYYQKTDSSIVVIVGEGHARQKSKIYKVLRSEGVPYEVVRSIYKPQNGLEEILKGFIDSV